MCRRKPRPKLRQLPERWPRYTEAMSILNFAAWRPGLNIRPAFHAIVTGAFATWVSVAIGAPEIALSPAQIRALGVATVAATASSGETLTAPAEVSVAPEQLEVISAPLAARVEAVMVAVGDVVSRGRPLVRLNGPQALDLARETQTAEAALTLARQSAQRDRQLLQSGLIAKSRAEASDAALAQAESRARSAQRQQQLQGVQGEQSVQSLSSRSGGVVLEVLAAPGSRVGPGDPLLRLARTDALWLDIRLPAAQAGQVGVGSTVTVAGRTVNAQVTQIGQAVLPGTQSLLVRARVSAGGSSLRLGELVEARVRVASTADGVSVPSRGVWRDAGQTWAFVQTAPGRYRTVNIDVLSDDGSSVATRSLKAGDLVVVQGIAALKSLRAGT